MKKFNMEHAIETITAADCMIMNDHTDRLIKIAGIGQLENGYYFPICDARYFSINDLYLDDNDQYHVSTWSVAGTIVPMDYNMDLEKAIEAYNEDIRTYRNQLDAMYPEDAPHSMGQMVVAYHLFV